MALNACSTSPGFIAISIAMVLSLIIGGFCVAFLLQWGLSQLALIPWHRSFGLHWTERARVLYPARKSARFNLLVLLVVSIVTTSVLDSKCNIFLPIWAAFLGALLGTYPLNREIFPEICFKSWLHQVVSVLLLLLGFWAALLIGIIIMPANLCPLAWVIAGSVLLVMVAFLFGFGVRLMQWLRLLKPAPEHLATLVSEMSQKMRVPVRMTWVLPTHLSNAVALPLTRELIFTEKLLSTHPDDEIKSICAHELGHLNEPRKVLLVRTFVTLSAFPLIFTNPASSLTPAPDGFLLLLIPVLLLVLVGIRVSRRMEKRADKIATQHQTDTSVYARALERLYRTNQMPAAMPRRSNKIHPDLYDRMLAAGVTPDFPRPAPAKGLSWASYLLLACVVVVPMLIGTIRTLWTIWNGAVPNTN